MNTRLRQGLLCGMAFFLLAACATPPGQVAAQYDFGTTGTPVTAVPALPAVAADVQAPAWLDSTRMIYRLAYADGRQVHAYANSRWAMRPAQLLAQRLKSRISQSGGTVLVGGGAAGLPTLRIELDDFSQIFDSVSQSHSQLTARVTLLQGGRLIAQKTLTRRVPAPTPDAPGGVAAMASAADALIDDILAWLASPASR